MVCRPRNDGVESETAGGHTERVSSRLHRRGLALVSAALLTGFLLGGVATASGLPRFYTTKPKSATASVARYWMQNASALHNVKCRLLDGNGRIGWRQIRCVDNGAAWGMTATPQSCTRV